MLDVRFSGPLATAAAENLAAYTVSSGKVKDGHKIFNSRYKAHVVLTHAIYIASEDRVMLVPRGNRRLPRREQLRVNASIVTDPLGRPINNGKDFTATVSKAGLVISEARALAAAPTTRAVSAREPAIERRRE